MSHPSLTPSQLHALFDILTHAETYQEIESLKDPEAVSKWGYPFTESPSGDGGGGGGGDGDGDGDGNGGQYAVRSASPILQMLLKHFVLSLPQADTVSPEFWSVRLQGILTKFAEAELSESYDKGALGTRKNLATAAASVVEQVARGILGGCPRGPVVDLKSQTYDMQNARDLARAWDDVVRHLVYGDLISDLFDFATENENIEEHSQAVKAAIEWAIIQLAGLLHHLYVVSADGPYLLKLIEDAHKLVPYSLIRQTLRVGNAASMINGMMKLLLAKISVGGVTNWIGLTKNADDGMNLLQRIMSLVLSWDASVFRKSAEKIEKARDGPGKDHLGALREHAMRGSRSARQEVRTRSEDECRSVIVSIFDSIDPELSRSLSEPHHAQCISYYSAVLSMEDRDKITTVLCRQNPDLFTHAVKELVAALDPIIRQVHDLIDLKEHLGDAEVFVEKFLEVGKGKKPDSKNGLGTPQRTPSTTKDYVELLRENKQLLYKWMHRVASQTPTVRDMFRDWAVETIKIFRSPDSEPQAHGSATGTGPDGSGGAGAMSTELNKLYVDLPEEKRQAVLSILDMHAAYLNSLEMTSVMRVQEILNELDGNGQAGGITGLSNPGVYLVRWQNLMDDTLVTPDKAIGAPRRGRDVKHERTQGKTGAESSGKNSRSVSPHPMASAIKSQLVNQEIPEAPDSSLVIHALGPAFKELLKDASSRS